MKSAPFNKIVLIGFMLVCLACVAGITFVFYDVVASYASSDISAYGAVVVFIMVIALVARKLWENRQT